MEIWILLVRIIYPPTLPLVLKRHLLLLRCFIYLDTGVLQASWKDNRHKDCPEQKHKIQHTVLMFGPSRTPKDPYYLKLETMDDEHKNVKVRLQSSRVTDSENKKWWKVKAKRNAEHGGYIFTGELASNSTDEEGNFYQGELRKPKGSDTRRLLEKCGTSDLYFKWLHQNLSSFVGFVDATTVAFTFNGTYKSTDREIFYSFAFFGAWKEGSSLLSTNEQYPTWPDNPPEVGNGSTLANGNRSDSDNGGNNKEKPKYPLISAGAGTLPVVLGSLNDNSVKPDVLPKPPFASPLSPPLPPSSLAEGTNTPPLGRGGVAGVTIAGVCVLTALISAAVWMVCRFKTRRKQRKPKTEPAYLYTAPIVTPAQAAARLGREQINYNSRNMGIQSTLPHTMNHSNPSEITVCASSYSGRQDWPLRDDSLVMINPANNAGSSNTNLGYARSPLPKKSYF
jgi:hypothetical protein